jgi:hypothetical protein
VLHWFLVDPLPDVLGEGRISREGVRLMQKYLIATAFVLATATPALAAAAQHFAVIDTVGNCAVVDTKPSPYGVSGLKILGDKSGYSSEGQASKLLKSDSSSCKGMIQRA